MRKIILYIISRERRKYKNNREMFREGLLIYREGGIKALLLKQISEEIKYSVGLGKVIYEDLLLETGYFQMRVWHVMLFTVVFQVLWFFIFSFFYACFLSPILNAESLILSAASDLLIFTLGIAPLIVVFLLTSPLKTPLFFLLFLFGAMAFKIPIHNLIVSNFL
ncbi:MAG: hypothetical protein BWX80_00939 [Candidatus Hydrogenedentes bacterium ADurb.Bin101]|nr:MAG: hypothetical protein BWX80_00939 [Candidatus Hydrogenedentes bacterium ADurb.Bin101]